MRWRSNNSQKGNGFVGSVLIPPDFFLSFSVKLWQISSWSSSHKGAVNSPAVEADGSAQHSCNSSPDFQDCAERHSKPSGDGTYGCVILEALGYQCNLNVLQATFHADKDTDKKKNRALSRISAVTFTWIRADEIYSQWFMFTKLLVYLKFK